MPRKRKILGYNGLPDFFAHRQKHGIAELHIAKGFTSKEEDRKVKKAFYEIANDFGYHNIDTLRVVPEDGRAPYFVRKDDVRKKIVKLTII